jgi:hypothetical protein
MSEDKCPKCGGSALTTGKAVTHATRGENRAKYFAPDGLNSRWFGFGLRSRTETPLVGGFQACLKCGLVWSHVSSEALQALIKENGTDEAKSHLPQ